MAAFTYTEYPRSQQQQTMASSDDFTLFPQFGWPQDQSCLPTTTYQDTYMQATTFDSAFPQPAYTQAMSTNHFDYNAMQEYAMHAKSGQRQPLSPRQSPAMSAANSFDCAQPNFMSSLSESGASAQSTISSTMASPAVMPQNQSDWNQRQQQSHLNVYPIIQQHDSFGASALDFDSIPIMDTTKGCVDPSLIQPYSPQVQIADQTSYSPQPNMYNAIPSPAPSIKSGKSPRVEQPKTQWQPYPTAYSSSSRRQSISSVHSGESPGSVASDDSNKGLCPIPSCRRHFKDLKAHMLTHQETRPEKCPIPTCEYHVKGFARKYDKNRHTLTHYKGTMVCGFCPGSGSAAEKSFNRADVFKRHLTSVHNVEQTPPNARRKTPPANVKRSAYGVRAPSGMCSTCNNAFASPQDFYEHLDDCVLRVVQQADPSEAVNAKLLSSIADDAAVQDTLERHMLSTDINGPTSFDDEEDEEDADFDDDNDSSKKSKARKAGASNPGSQSAHPRGVSGQHVGSGNSHLTSAGAVAKPGARKGLTLSKGGVALAGGAMSGKGSKRRKNYPLSWGAGPEKMRMKKRVLCVYDGQRRLWKDDMMLDANHEVRIPLPGVGDGRAYVSDLDVRTMQRAEGLHNATEEEKGPWLPDEDLQELMKTA